MSTTYGYASVAFPGFPPLTVSTVEGYAMFRQVPWGYRPVTFLPNRTEKFAGKRRRLSRAERSRLRTLAKRWSKGRHFRTLHRETF